MRKLMKAAQQWIYKQQQGQLNRHENPHRNQYFTAFSGSQGAAIALLLHIRWWIHWSMSIQKM
jgi:hypothetical protein